MKSVEACSPLDIPANTLAEPWQREGLCCRSARVIVTASGGMRGSKRVELKEIVDAAAKAAADKGHKVRPLLLRH